MQFFTFAAFVHCITPTTPYLESLLKRFFDVFFALFITCVCHAVAGAFLWLLNLFVGGGPLFFSHQREGKERKLFWCYKFRTFPKSAVHPKPGESLSEHPSLGWEPCFAVLGLMNFHKS